MTTVYLIRHATTDTTFGPGDAPLAPFGVHQAEATVTYLCSHNLMHVFSSPLRRAVTTARILATYLAIPVTIDPRLRERMNWGDLAGQSRQEFAALWQRCSREPSFMPLPGVSAQTAAQRLAAFLFELHDHYPEARLAAVTHGGIITDFLHQYVPQSILTTLHPGFATSYDPGLANCSITSIHLTNAGYQIDSFASDTHLG
jgi:broad specificity phosphatase PhoE